MKTNELTMELKHIDIAEILANYRNPLFWKKRWCVFKTQDFYCVWKLNKINIEDNVIESTVVINYTGKKYKTFFINSLVIVEIYQSIIQSLIKIYLIVIYYLVLLLPLGILK